MRFFFSALHNSCLQANVSTLESVGLFVTLSLGGLGMFLVVLSVTFLFGRREDVVVNAQGVASAPDDTGLRSFRTLD